MRARTASEAKALLVQVVDGLDPRHGERETLRSLAAAAEVLTLDGQHEIAAVAMGGAQGMQDQFVDYLGRTRRRLLGADGLAVLESEGAELELGHVVARVRDALPSS